MGACHSGGKGATVGATAASGGATQVDNSQVQQAQPTQTMSSSYNAFVNMTDDDKADVIDSMVSQDVPAHLSNSDFQKFIYNIGLNDKPQLVDDATLNSMKGKEIFRTVNNVFDSNNDISYSADQIARQLQAGRITRTSDSGGSVYGRGLYFADSRTESTYYGNTRGNVKKTAVVRAKLNDNAKIITDSAARSGAAAEISSGSKLGKALAKCDRASQKSIYAMAKGYNVIDANNGTGYFNILNRQAVTMSKTIEAK